MNKIYEIVSVFDLYSLKGRGMKPYIVYDTAPNEGACLVFAHNIQEARKIGYEILKSWYWESEWIHCKARLLRNNTEQLYAQADQEKLKDGIPHAIESPKSCKICGKWGMPLNTEDICENCEHCF